MSRRGGIPAVHGREEVKRDVVHGRAQLAAAQGEPLGHRDVVDRQDPVMLGVGFPRAGRRGPCGLLVLGEAGTEGRHETSAP